jgi:integrase
MAYWQGVRLPRYVVQDKQRDGTPRFLFRRQGFPKATLPTPGNKEFWEAYAVAMTGQKPIKRSAHVLFNEATFGWLCHAYVNSADVAMNDDATRRLKQRCFISMGEEPVSPGSQLLMKHCPLENLNRSHVIMWRDRKKDAPHVANQRIRFVSLMFKWAIENDHLKTNPAEGVKLLKTPKGGFHTWTQEEIARFEQAYPVGTRARLAMAIMLYTGMRISDAVTLGPPHVKNEWIEKVQFKNRKRQGRVISIPLLPVLREIIDATPTGSETFLITESGQPYTRSGIADRFKEWCNRVNMPHCTAHGLRKAGAVNAAENGASESQIKAIFGWEGAHEVAVYTAKRDRKRLAAEAMELIMHKAPKKQG